jgi:hypothetical protein
MSDLEYITNNNDYKGKDKEPNPEGLSMVDLCRKYFPNGYFYSDDGSLEYEEIERIIKRLAPLDDKQAHGLLTNTYNLSPEKASGLVRDSTGYRSIMQKLKTVREITTIYQED